MFIKPVGKPESELVYKIRLEPFPVRSGITKAKSRNCHRIMGLIFVYTVMSLMVVKVVSTAAQEEQQHPHQHQHQQQQQQQQLLNNIEPTSGWSEIDAVSETTPGTESDNYRDSSTQLAERQNIEKMRAKLQQLQHEQQQQYRQQQLQMQLHLQQMHQQMQMQLYANGMDMARREGEGEVEVEGKGGAGETAYLLERADDVAPIYGTWRTKARRPQPPSAALQHATSMAALQLNTLGDSDASTNSHFDDNNLYERLPKRSVTMTPLRDQLPRPPRLSTQRPPSAALLRRQFSETPGSLALREDYKDYKPKPFNFPFEGPLPEHFKKGESERPHMAINNIQDILHNLHINSVLPSKMPSTSLVMMPTGLTIAGSYKNLKSSGIANFLRGKRNKKQMQFSIPLPMLQMGMPMSIYGAAPHQRVAIEQLYPFKPRSPQDINLLAMQQPSSKPKKNKKQQQALSNYNMLLEHGSQQHFVADPFLQSFPPIITLNATRQPQHKRVPFKVNLDIYPVLPPSRPTSVLRNPFQADYSMPSTSALTGSSGPVYGQSHMHNGIYQTPFRFPTQPTTHMPMTFPEQSTRYSQQALYQSHKFGPHPQSSGMTEDCVQSNYNNGNTGSVDSHSNQIMLHLNVFPKQKPPSMTPMLSSTNPFYNYNSNYNSVGSGTGAGLQRNAVTIRQREPPMPKPPSPIEPRQVTSSQGTNRSASVMQGENNQTQQQQQLLANHTISRSDNISFLDLEHPIVAAEVPQLPHPAALTGNAPTSHQRYELQTDHYRFPKSSNIDQLAAEAQTASLFRFPVEDLIQFQVDDAL